jgi:hypothetical protein
MYIGMINILTANACVREAYKTVTLAIDVYHIDRSTRLAFGFSVSLSLMPKLEPSGTFLHLTFVLLLKIKMQFMWD